MKWYDNGMGILTAVLSDTGEPVFLPFRMSCYVLSNLVVTAGMLTPGLQVRLSDKTDTADRADTN